MARFEAFWDVMCDFKHYLWLGIMVLIFLLVLTLIPLFLGSPGTGPSVIIAMNLVMILIAGSVMVFMYRVCAKRETQYY